VITQERLWPMMTREQGAELFRAAEKVMEMMRVHLGREAAQYRLLDIALFLAFEELERKVDARRSDPVAF
jgi:hypothetical protein